MKKRVCGIITMCAFLCISPVNASATSFDNINEMLNKINGEDGFVEASECVIDKNTKSLHLSVVISENVPLWLAQFGMIHCQLRAFQTELN